jgi:nucleoside-diphosphate-sugar epimerase
MGDRVLVTGAAGFVGRHLIEQLVERGDDNILATDIVETPPERYEEHVSEEITYITGDSTD